MDWLDYRQALGLSFNDDQKKSLFIKRIEVFMQSGENCPFEEQDEIGLAYMIGESYLLAEQDSRDLDFGNDPLGLQRAWLYLSKRTKSFADFLSCLVALINTYGGEKTDKRTILSGIKKALEDCRISFGNCLRQKSRPSGSSHNAQCDSPDAHRSMPFHS
jgi:hypothetical protein